ncbi:hypothetical protein GXW82_16065 [Streptacidiphilus sp. 4-A2]|nr:hypothetical protein [Streptacidiphilus sp. 4-A2]
MGDLHVEDHACECTVHDSSIGAVAEDGIPAATRELSSYRARRTARRRRTRAHGRESGRPRRTSGTAPVGLPTRIRPHGNGNGNGNRDGGTCGNGARRYACPRCQPRSVRSAQWMSPTYSCARPARRPPG